MRALECCPRICILSCRFGDVKSTYVCTFSQLVRMKSMRSKPKPVPLVVADRFTCSLASISANVLFRDFARFLAVALLDTAVACACPRATASVDVVDLLAAAATEDSVCEAEGVRASTGGSGSGCIVLLSQILQVEMTLGCLAVICLRGLAGRHARRELTSDTSVDCTDGIFDCISASACESHVSVLGFCCLAPRVRLPLFRDRRTRASVAAVCASRGVLADVEPGVFLSWGVEQSGSGGNVSPMLPRTRTETVHPGTMVYPHPAQILRQVVSARLMSDAAAAVEMLLAMCAATAVESGKRVCEAVWRCSSLRWLSFVVDSMVAGEIDQAGQ
ncbi:hypothetical protein ABW21_db0201100 [Orbilia brochopaga]|nr:hypothetical protein ABW21_db0201100 [Drechslerella brochopaga]